MAAVIPEDLVGKLILAGILALQSARLWLSRRNAKRIREPGEDRRMPLDFDQEEYWQLKAQVQSIQQRMDHANVKLSELTSKFIRLPSELKREFLDLELGQEWAQQCKGDRQSLHAKLDRLTEKLDQMREATPWPKRIDRNRG